MVRLRQHLRQSLPVPVVYKPMRFHHCRRHFLCSYGVRAVEARLTRRRRAVGVARTYRALFRARPSEAPRPCSLLLVEAVRFRKEVLPLLTLRLSGVHYAAS